MDTAHVLSQLYTHASERTKGRAGSRQGQRGYAPSPTRCLSRADGSAESVCDARRRPARRWVDRAACGWTSGEGGRRHGQSSRHGTGAWRASTMLPRALDLCLYTTMS